MTISAVSRPKHGQISRHSGVDFLLRSQMRSSQQACRRCRLWSRSRKLHVFPRRSGALDPKSCAVAAAGFVVTEDAVAIRSNCMGLVYDCILCDLVHALLHPSDKGTRWFSLVPCDQQTPIFFRSTRNSVFHSPSNQPPVKPARRRPSTMFGALLAISQRKPER